MTAPADGPLRPQAKRRNLFGMTVMYMVILSLIRGTILSFVFRTNIDSENMVGMVSLNNVRVSDKQTVSETTTAFIPSLPDRSIQKAVQSQIVVSNNDTYNPLSGCAVTSQVILRTNESQWMMQSLDVSGNPKTLGGDEYYVTYTSSNKSDGENESNSTANMSTSIPTAVALVTDLQNGTYKLDFVSTPLLPPANDIVGNQGGTIRIHFVYTCGIGNAHPPLKQAWKTGGATLISHEHKVQTSPPIRAFQPPTLRDDKSLSSYSSVVYFGDSHIRQLVGYWKAAKTFHHRKHTIYKENPRRALSTSTMDSMLEMLKQWHGHHLQRTNNTALILGSSAWDVGSHEDNGGRPPFDDHLEAVRGFVSTAQKRYPNVAIYWKEPAAIHIHCANQNCWSTNRDCSTSIQYMSDSRIQYLRNKQATIMSEINVDVLKVYEGTYLSAHWHSSGDALHYERYFNEQMQGWLYNDPT